MSCFNFLVQIYEKLLPFALIFMKKINFLTSIDACLDVISILYHGFNTSHLKKNQASKFLL
jgi:hypothetical protein